MFPRTVELAFLHFQRKRDAKALAIVFDRTAPELLRVARHLAPAPGDAEDLVQATFLKAIEAADGHERGRPVLPWLLGILANQARAARRSARRRPDPERVRRDDVADVESDVARAELEQRLSATIAALPEVYRPVLRLWFEHGLEAKEIAATLERPAGTVRAQISRGIEMLRSALPAGLAGATAVAVVAGPGLAAVRAKVLAGCAGTSAGFGSALAIGGLLMLHNKIISLAAVAAVAALSWFTFAAPGDGAPLPAPGSEGTAMAATGALASNAPPPAPAGPERSAVVVDEEPPPLPAPAPEPVPATAGVEVTLVSAEDGAPLAGWGVALSPTRDVNNFARSPRFTATDAAGIVRFAGTDVGDYYVEVDRVGIAGAIYVVAHAATRRTIRVPAGQTVTGIVVDADGRPVVAAAVVAQGDNLAAPTLAVSDAHGRFELASVGQVALQARHPGYTPSAAFVVPGSGARHEIELRLARAGCRLAGRAFDVAGAPLAGASVAVVAVMNKTYALGAAATQQRPLLLRADADGAFATDEVAAGEYLVLARARDPEITPVWAKVDTTAGEAFVELRCEHPTVIEGVVRGLDETTAKEVRITVFPNESNQELGSLLNLVGMRTTGVGPDGAFRIVGAMPGEQTVQAYRGMAPIGRREVEVAAGDTVRCEFSLSADEALAIELVMPPGVALSPGRVFAYVYDLAQDSSANQVPGIVVFTGGAGRLENPPAGEAQIMVIVLLGEAGGHAQIAKQHIGAGEREVRIEIDAAALPSRTIRGRLVDDRRAPVANEAVVADRTDGNGLFAHVQGRTLADGRFEIGPLPAGSYSLAVLRGDHGEPIGSAVVTAAGDEDVGDLTFPPR